MSSYTDGLNEAAENAFCDLTRAGVAGGLIFTGLTATTVVGALAGLAVTGISAHLYASYCGRPPPPPPYGTPQDWNGGQCDGISYRVTVTIALILSPKTSNVPVGDVGDVFDAVGPISLIKVYDTGGTDNDIRVQAAWKGGSRNASFVKGNSNDPENPQWGYNNVRITVVRNDGLTDLCGNPAPAPPPDRFENPGNITYINREGVTINAPVTFDFRGARLGINGDVHIPVNIRFNLDPTLNISGTLNLNSGNVTINPRGTPTPPAGSDDPDGVYIPPGAPPPTPPGAPPDPPTPPTPPDPAQPKKIIRGVIVTTILNDTDATIIFQDEAPDIYAPSLGYVAFLCLINNVYCWSADIPIKNVRQIVECPWRYGAVDVKATPKPGASFSISKIFDINSIAGTQP